MMRIDFINGTTRVLGLAATILVLIVALELVYPARPADVETAVAENGARVIPEFTDAGFEPPRFDEFGDLLDRPLLFESRRLPDPPAVQAAPTAPPAPLRLRLEGIAIAGDSRIAVLRDLGDNRLVQLAEGMRHESWVLQSVSADRATFVRGMEIAELVLDPSARR